MSIQFSRSVQSLNIDSFRASKIGLIIGSLLMFTLILWFFFARVSVHEISHDVRFNEDGRILATFSEEAFTRIQPGQDALIRIFNAAEGPPLAVQGFVYDVFPERNQAEIIIVSENLFDIPETNNINAQVDVEIEKVTPFNLIMRYSGQFVETDQGETNSQTESSANTQ
ncbi:MAG: hypothetical protein ACWGN2_03095 [Anaerolineales bacterium]